MVHGAQIKIREAMEKLPAIAIAPHRFGGIEFLLGKREVGHLHGDELIDIPFPMNVRNDLVAANKASPHHILPKSGWVSIFLRSSQDVDRGIELLKLSFELARSRKAGPSSEITGRTGASR